MCLICNSNFTIIKLNWSNVSPQSKINQMSLTCSYGIALIRIFHTLHFRIVIKTKNKTKNYYENLHLCKIHFYNKNSQYLAEDHPHYYSLLLLGVRALNGTYPNKSSGMAEEANHFIFGATAQFGSEPCALGASLNAHCCCGACCSDCCC